MSCGLGTHSPRVTGGGALQPPGGLLRAPALEQIVGPQHDDQQIRAGGEGGGGGGNLPAVLPQVGDRPAGFRSQDVHPPAVRVIPPAEITPRVVAVGVGVAEADDVHRPFSFLCMLEFSHIIKGSHRCYLRDLNFVRITSSAGQNANWSISSTVIQRMSLCSSF